MLGIGLSLPQIAGSSSAFTPAKLFAGGEPGAWYDPSDLATLFQDNLGATPVTAVEQTVGLMLDKSGRGNNASQATAGSRPVLSARVNIWAYSEQFNNAVWTKTNCPITTDQVANPLTGTVTADLAIPSAVSGVHSVAQSATTVAGSYTVSVYVKAAGYSRVGFRENTSSGSYATFLLSGAGSVISTNAATGSVTALSNGWYRVSMTHTASAGARTYAIYVFDDAYTGTAPQSYVYTGNGTSGVYLWGGDIRAATESASLPVYQRVVTGATADYDTTGFPYFLRFDGSNDSLSTGSIDFSGTSKVSVFAGLRKQSDAAQGMVVELTADASANNGGFYLSAPESIAANYNFSSRGTTKIDNTITTYTAPLTSLVTGLGDISAPSNIIRVNGAQVGSAVTTSQGTGNYANAAMHIGRRGGSTLPFSGRLYSLIVRGAASSATHIAAAEAWVNGKVLAY